MNIPNSKLPNALFPRVRQLVLGLFFTHPTSHFYTNEIIRLTGAGSGVVQRELSRLVSAGVLTIETVGKQKHYQANHHSPVYQELRGLIIKTFGLADVIKAALSPLAKDIEYAFIYGSVAKSQDNSESDIDLMLICNKLTYAELFPILEKPEEQLGRKVNPTFYTAKEWINKHSIGNNFVLKVKDQPKIFLIGDKDAFEQLR